MEVLSVMVEVTEAQILLECVQAQLEETYVATVIQAYQAQLLLV